MLQVMTILIRKTLWERVSPIALNLLKETTTMKRNFRKNAKTLSFSTLVIPDEPEGVIGDMLNVFVKNYCYL